MKLPSGKHAYEILIVLIVVLMAIYTHAQEPEAEALISSTSSETIVESETSTSTEGVGTPPSSSEAIHAEHRAQLERRFQDRIFNLSRNVSNRLEASINRLLNISNRLDSRIVKLKNAGVDTSSAEAKLGEARDSLREAQSNFESLPSVQQALTSETPRESLSTIRTTFFTTRDLIKKTHAQLTETVTLLKYAPTQHAIDATTTPDTSATKTVE